MSTVAPSKSVGDFLGMRVMAFMRECECELAKAIIKSDNEPAMLAMVDNLIAIRVEKALRRPYPRIAQLILARAMAW